MNVFLRFFITFICLLTIKAHAYDPKEGNITAIFGPFFHKTNFEDDKSGALSPTQGGFALIANGDANDRESLEIAIFYMPKTFMMERGGFHITEETQLLQMGMGYKRWLSKIWAVSLAFYSSYSMGDPHTIHNDFPPDTEPMTSARDTTEYGLDLAFQYEIWQKDRWGMVADARYSRSLTPKPDEIADHYGVLIGLRYFVQEKEKN